MQMTNVFTASPAIQTMQNPPLYHDFDSVPQPFQSLLHLLADGVLVTDREGRLALFNDSALEMILQGYQRRLVQGVPVFQIFPEHTQLKKEFYKVLKGQELSYEVPLRIEGQTAWWQCTHQPIRIQGAVTGVFTTLHNITPEKIIVKRETHKRHLALQSIIDKQETERRNLSLELHENINQVLSSCKLMLEVAKEAEPSAPLEQTYQSLNTVIKEIRRISRDLTPPAIADIGLADALTEMIRPYNNRHTAVHLRHFLSHAHHALPHEDQVAVYRMAQELVHHALQHAQATEVFITVLVNELRVYISVKDNGLTSELFMERRKADLQTIRHRAETYHGIVKLKTAPGKGCRVQVALFPGRG